MIFEVGARARREVADVEADAVAEADVVENAEG